MTAALATLAFLGANVVKVGQGGYVPLLGAAPPFEQHEHAGGDPRANLLQDMGAVYLTVVNPGPESDRLLRVETGLRNPQ